MLNLLLAAVFALMWTLDLNSMIRRRQTGELIAFACVWSAGLALSFLVLYDIEVDVVTRALKAIFEPLGRSLIVPPPR